MAAQHWENGVQYVHLTVYIIALLLNQAQKESNELSKEGKRRQLYIVLKICMSANKVRISNFWSNWNQNLESRIHKSSQGYCQEENLFKTDFSVKVTFVWWVARGLLEIVLFWISVILPSAKFISFKLTSTCVLYILCCWAKILISDNTNKNKTELDMNLDEIYNDQSMYVQL